MKMKKKLCCILMLITLLLNSSVMITISEAVEVINETLSENESETKPIIEAELTKYVNFDTTTEGSDTGSKGVLIQFNVKTGIEYPEEQEYKAIQKTISKIEAPEINGNKPERATVILKSTKATNGGMSANWDYTSEGILTITAENEEYTDNVPEARDEYEVIFIYGDDCYNDNEERNLVLEINLTEELKDVEQNITDSKELNFNVKENIGKIISCVHETDNVYNGYITANAINSSNKYETTYNDRLQVMISNKEIAQILAIGETNIFNSEIIYKETNINKEQLLKILGENGSLEIYDGENVVSINKDTTADDNGNIKITYENESQNLIIKLKNIEKEGIIEFENTKVIEPTITSTEYNEIETGDIIKGINTISKETINENGETETSTTDEVKYEEIERSQVEIKQAISNIDTKLNVDNLVNSIQNDVVFTVTLRTDDPKYSLFKNPTITIEMPDEVEDVSLGKPSLMYNNQIFEIIDSNVTKNDAGHKVVSITLQGSQEVYETSSVVEGTNILIPLTIYLNKQITDTVSNFKFTFSNEITGTTETKNMEVTLLNKIGTIIPKAYSTNIENTKVFESNGVQVEIIEEVGNTIVPDGGGVYEEQIIKHIVKFTNNTTSKQNITFTANLPEKMDCVQLNTTYFVYNEKYNDYTKYTRYSYTSKGKMVNFDVKNLEPGKTYETYFEIQVQDLADDQDNVQANITYDMKIGETTAEQISVQNIIQQTKITAFTKCYYGTGKNDWNFGIEVKNLTNTELKNVKLVFEASSIFTIKKAECLNDIGYEEIGSVDGNLWTCTIDSIPANSTKNCSIAGIVEGALENDTNTYELNGVTTVYGDEINTYTSNKSRMTGDVEAVDVKMTSDKENKSLKYEDEITYTITIENTGRVRKGVSIYTAVNILDTIPREFEPISATYNDFVINSEYVKDENEVNRLVTTYTEETKTLDLSNLVIPDGYDKDDAPNINLSLKIPEGKTVTIAIKAKVRMLYENVTVTNTVIAQGDYIQTKTASLQNTLYKYDYVEPEEPEVPEVPEEPETPWTDDPLVSNDPKDPVTPVEPSEPDDPNKPTDPSNPGDSGNSGNSGNKGDEKDPSKPIEEKVTISGTAWIDSNENGKRDSGESLYSNLEIMIYDYKNNKPLTNDKGNFLTVKTDNDGKYQFNNLTKGQYIVIFLYDNNTYSLTEYNKTGVNTNLNSDVVEKTVRINGEARVAGVTDALQVNANVKNIDIGLIEKKDFDLEIEKYVSKITVQTDDKSKTYTYNNKKLAKTEINSKKINGATVVVEYKIVVTNKGEIEGKAAQIIDNLPDGMKFYSELNKDWYENKGKLYTTSLAGEKIGVGESKEVILILTKTMNANNVGTVTNTAEISISSNEKAIEDQNSSNDTSKADVIISVSTGLMKWIGITMGIIIGLAVVAILIMKNKKLLKITTFMIVFGMLCFSKSDVFAGQYLPDSTTFYDVDTQESDGHGGYGVTTQTTINGQTVYATCADNSKPWNVGGTTHTGTLESESANTTGEEWGPTLYIRLENATQNNSVAFTKIDNTYNKVGPFKINCYPDGGVSIKNSSITIDYVNTNGQTITNAGFELENFGWGRDFYIKIPNTVMKVLKIHAGVEGEYTQNGTIHVSVSGMYNCGSNIQPMSLSIDSSYTTTRTQTTSASTDVNGPWTAQGNLKIVKQDKEDPNNTTLKKAEFKLLKGTNTYGSTYMQLKLNGQVVQKLETESEITLQNYVAYGDFDANNPTTAIVDGKTYTVNFYASASNATIIVTNSSGSVTINNLRCGQYTLVEVTSNNYGYTLNVTENRIGFTALNTTTWAIKNEKQTGNLRIEKVDYDDHSVKLQNVEFVIKAQRVSSSGGSLNHEMNNKFIKLKLVAGSNVTVGEDGYATRAVGQVRVQDMVYTGNGTGDVIAYTDNIAEATVFVTDGNGVISIANLITSTNGTDKIKYAPQEIKNPNYGYAEDLTGYYYNNVTYCEGASTNGWSNPLPRKSKLRTDEVNCTDYYKILISNLKLTGNLHIDKLDYDLDKDGTERTLGGVEFVLRAQLKNTNKLNQAGDNYADKDHNMNGLYIRIKAEGDNIEKGNDGFADRAVGAVRVADNVNRGDSIKYTSNIEEATKFVTDDNGEIYINNLLKGTDGNDHIQYHIEEYKNPNYGYVAEMGDYNNETVRFKSATVSDHWGHSLERVKQSGWVIISRNYHQETSKIKPGENERLNATITNIKQTGNLHIEKIDDRCDTKVLGNVEFVLRAERNDVQNDETNVYYDKIDGKYVRAKVDADSVSETYDDGYAKKAVGDIRILEIQYVDTIDEATRFTTDSNGKLSVINLLISTNGADHIDYHLEEVANHNYGYIADEDEYNNFRVTFDENSEGGWLDIQRETTKDTDQKDSDAGLNTIIKNEQMYIRISGIVWEDISNSKDNQTDNIYSEETDALIKGIKVHLYKDGKYVTTAETDENGYYEFGTKIVDGVKYVNGVEQNGAYDQGYGNEDYWPENERPTAGESNQSFEDKPESGNTVQSPTDDPNDAQSFTSDDIDENGNIVIKDLDRYHIEFEYDGLRFTTVATSWDYSDKDETGSKGKEVPSGHEDGKDRETVDNDFREVSGNQIRTNSSDTITGSSPEYSLQYTPDTEEHSSTYIDHWKYNGKDSLEEPENYPTNSEGKKYLTSEEPSDEDYAVVASTKTSGYDLSEKWKASYETSGAEVITNNNQGVFRREQPDNAISADLDKVETIINGYKNTYTYGKRSGYQDGTEGDGFGVEVKFGNKYNESQYSSRGLTIYSRPLYASDLAYNLKNPGALQVYVTYKIVLKNQSSTLQTQINEIVNYYDSRYEQPTVTGNGNLSRTVTGTDFNRAYISLNNTIGSQETETIYLTFRMKDEALREVAHERATLNNVSEISSYTTLYGDTTVCAENEIGTKTGVYAGIDTDSAPHSSIVKVDRQDNTTEIAINGDASDNQQYTTDPGTLGNQTYSTPVITLGDKDTFEDDTDFAPSLVLGIDEDDPTRGVSGIVYEDETRDELIKGEVRLGDGMYKQGENPVVNAKVELMNSDNTNEPTTLYHIKITNNGAECVEVPASQMTTDGKDYNYKLLGVIPDEYLLRYTYDDNSKINGENINVRNYKSTIIVSDTIKTALDLESDPSRRGDLNWIIKNAQDGTNGNRYSDAVDDLEKREKIDNIYYGTNDTSSYAMTADSAIFDVGVEFDKDGVTQYETYTTVDEEFKLDENQILVLKDTNGDGEGDKLVRMSTFCGVNPYQDFGIVERARQDIYVDKRISDLKITLSSGQVLVSGNPYKTKLPYVVALENNKDPREDREKLVKIEIDNEIMHGALLEVKYSITVYNESEKDFDYREDKRFYYYGQPQDGRGIINAVAEVVDYMETSLFYNDEKNEEAWQKVDVIYLKDKDYISPEVEEALSGENKNKFTIAVTDKFATGNFDENNQFTTDSNARKGIAAGECGTISIEGSKLLASTAEDLNYENHTEILHTEAIRQITGTTPGNYSPVSKTVNEQDDDWIKLVITPPTGLPVTSKIK